MIHTVRRLRGIYPRLIEELGTTSRGKSTDNAAGRGDGDPHRIPVNPEVLDLLGNIEYEIPSLARWVCEACRWPLCVAPERVFVGSRRVTSPRVLAGFDTLLHYWPVLEDYARPTAEAMHGRFSKWLSKAERLVGETLPPAALSSLCPECGEPSIFRIDTMLGWKAVCSNPDCGEDGVRREWTETEWEDAQHGARYVHNR